MSGAPVSAMNNESLYRKLAEQDNRTLLSPRQAPDSQQRADTLHVNHLPHPGTTALPHYRIITAPH